MNSRMITTLGLMVVLIAGCEDRSVSGAITAVSSSSEQDRALSNIENEYDAAEKGTAGEWQSCPEQRREVCPQIYRPVCGRIDTGIRCVTTPCPSFTTRTFGNACSACGHAEVISFRDGRCDSDKTEATTE